MLLKMEAAQTSGASSTHQAGNGEVQRSMAGQEKVNIKLSLYSVRSDTRPWQHRGPYVMETKVFATG